MPKLYYRNNVWAVLFMAEIHIIGQICSAKQFPKQSLFCKWNVQFGNNWKVLCGKKEGQTLVASSEFEKICYWSFPVDIHFVTNGIQGWPKFYLEVYNVDWLGLSHLYGYGFITVPTSPGIHIIDCFIWRPFGSLRERFVQFFLGGGPQLKYADSVLTANDRYKLTTETMGIVTLEITTILRNFHKFGIEYK